MSIPLLLTGTINTNPFYGGMNNIAVKDTKERLSQYDNAIRRYIKETEFDKIVFVETSEYPLQCDDYYAEAEKYGKKFEYITFLGNAEMVKDRGKSYGEAEAIKYALENSQLLKSEETIYKITGRIFLVNSKSILKKKNNSRNEFISFSRLCPERCVTYIFKFNKSDYIKFFFNCQEKCDEKQGEDIETVFYRIIINSGIEHTHFARYPRMSGIIGGLGIKYDKSWINYLAKNILLKFGFFTVK